MLLRLSGGLALASVALASCSLLMSPAPSPPTVARPAWMSTPLTDVRTARTFTIDDFSGRVVLIETIAEWCPNCLFQQHESRLLRAGLTTPSDLVLISLDVDSHEDEASLAQYADEFAFDWYFAVAPLEVQRALGNLYSAEYLNPPLEPMLLIDRHGAATSLPYGHKDAATLRQLIAPHL
jgi:hypothetical protein